MGTGWRRAFCTTTKKDLENYTGAGNAPLGRKIGDSPSPTRSCARLGFFSGGSNPATPRLSPTLRCKTTSDGSNNEDSRNDAAVRCSRSTNSTPKKSGFLSLSNPSSPRSPLKLSLFKNSFKFRSSCGVCLSSVKTGQGTAIYTAECGHAFHFPCIASHVGKLGKLLCPVCGASWKDVPLLSLHTCRPQPDDLSFPATGDDTKPPQPQDKPVVFVETTTAASPPSPTTTAVVKAVPPGITRSYDDDEPLASPAARGGFVPIPEADEENDEEDEDDGYNYGVKSDGAGAGGEDGPEEFQGFFVNPSSIKSDDVRGFRNTRGVQVRALPESAVISSSRGYETYAVVLRVKAPKPLAGAAASRRAPIDLVTVLDVSGSMGGPRLHMLKRAMRLVVSSLGPADRLSIVAFSSTSLSKRLLPLVRMTPRGQRAARRIVDRLVPAGQGTSGAGEALRKATKVLEDRRERNPVASVMLLSDGQAQGPNNSSQRPGSGHVSSTRFSHVEIPVQAWEDAFAKRVGGLLSVVAQDLRIQLGFAPGSAPAEIVAVYSHNNGRPAPLGSGSIRLGDLYAEEERELLVEVRAPAPAGPHRDHVISVRCLYKDPATQEVVYGRDQNTVLPRSSTTDPRVERLRILFVSTRATAEARRLVERGDHESARSLLLSSRELVARLGGAQGEHVRGLEAELAELHWLERQREMVAAAAGRNCSQRRVRKGEEMMVLTDENGEPLTPTSAWRAAERLAKVAMVKKSLNRVSDLHGFENARF